MSEVPVCEVAPFQVRHRTWCAIVIDPDRLFDPDRCAGGPCGGEDGKSHDDCGNGDPGADR